MDFTADLLREFDLSVILLAGVDSFPFFPSLRPDLGVAERLLREAVGVVPLFLFVDLLRLLLVDLSDVDSNRGRRGCVRIPYMVQTRISGTEK